MTDTLEDQLRAAARAEAERIRDEARAAANRFGMRFDEDEAPVTETLTLQDALQRCVYVSSSMRVVLFREAGVPPLVLTLQEFKNMFKASRATTPNGAVIEITTAWERSDMRINVDEITWHPNRPTFIRSNGGNSLVVNIWTEKPPRIELPADWEQRCAPFFEHLKYLIAEKLERNLFLDWLAHVEQAPGVLPHFGFLMFTPQHGIGRNWVSRMLAEVWPGDVAQSVDLGNVLKGGFNSNLSQKTLIIVDEVAVNSGDSPYQIASSIRQMVTAEVREINRKYGAKWTEHNCCRWLLLTNEYNAMPLPATDRRFCIIRNPDVQRSPDYYARIYNALEDEKFIRSIREFFIRRDVSKFNPGQRPPANAARTLMIENTRGAVEAKIAEALDDYDRDLITANELRDRADLDESELRGRGAHAFSHAMLRRRAAQLKGRYRINGQQQRIWALRRVDYWESLDRLRDSDKIAAELTRDVEARNVIDLPSNASRTF